MEVIPGFTTPDPDLSTSNTNVEGGFTLERGLANVDYWLISMHVKVNIKMVVVG